MIKPIFGLAETSGASDPKLLAEAYGPWTGIRSNHVITPSGLFSGGDGSSRSISTKEDKALLIEMRSHSDLIVVDAATARLEKYRTPSSGASLAIFSLSGNFEDIPAVNDLEARVFLFSASADRISQADSKNMHVQILGKPFEGFLSWADYNGFKSILLEAGPTLTALAFEAGIVRQSAVTKSPTTSSDTPETQQNPFDRGAVLESFAQSEDASFSLWTH